MSYVNPQHIKLLNLTDSGAFITLLLIITVGINYLK